MLVHTRYGRGRGDQIRNNTASQTNGSGSNEIVPGNNGMTI